MNPRVSVCLGSSRPGGLDLSLLGLVAQTFTDFEVIFVDSRYHVRHEQVLDAVKASGLRQPFFHVPNHRYGDDAWGPYKTAAGFNTGFMLSAGEIVILLCDYGYARFNWIDNHLREHTAKRLVMASHQYRMLPRLKIGDVTLQDEAWVAAGGTLWQVIAQRERFAAGGEISIFAQPLTIGDVEALPVEGIWNTDGKVGLPSGPAHHTYMHTKNESVPLESLLDVNGIDENYDRGRGPFDTCVGRRLTQSGCEGWLAGGAGILVCNPRKIMPSPNITLQDENFPGRWGPVRGMAHLAETEGNVRARNPYDLRERRDEIWGWREMSQEREAVIPKNVISDNDYFK